MLRPCCFCLEFLQTAEIDYDYNLEDIYQR
jgi:hypothetical protein